MYNNVARAVLTPSAVPLATHSLRCKTHQRAIEISRCLSSPLFDHFQNRV